MLVRYREMVIGSMCGFCGIEKGPNAPLRVSYLDDTIISHESCDEQHSSDTYYIQKAAGLEKEERPTNTYDIDCSCGNKYTSYKNPDSRRAHDRPQCKCGKRVEKEKTFIPKLFNKTLTHNK